MVKFPYLSFLLLSIAFVLLFFTLSPYYQQSRHQASPALHQSTPTDVPWQKFRNEQYNFEIEYPPQAALRQTSSDLSHYQLQINQDSLIVYLSIPKQVDPLDSSYQKVNFQGREAYLSQTGSNSLDYLIYHNGQPLTFSFRASNRRDSNLIAPIISRFKLL